MGENLACRPEIWSVIPVFVVVALYTVLQLPLFASGASSPGTAMASVRANSQPGTRLSSNGDSADTLALQRGAQQARELFLQGDFNGAVVAVDAVQALFEQGAAFRADDGAWAAWADSALTRALALRRLGKEEAADDELRSLAVVRPTFAPDASFAPPKVVSRFEALREQLLHGPTVAVTVDVSGSGSFFLDGRSMAAGVLDVLPGIHWFGSAGTGQRLNIDKAQDIHMSSSQNSANNTSNSTGDNREFKSDVNLGMKGTHHSIKHTDETAATRAGGHAQDSPDVAAEDGLPWLWIGVGSAALAAATAVVVISVALAQPAVANPGGTTIKVDISLLDPPDGG